MIVRSAALGTPSSAPSTLPIWASVKEIVAKYARRWRRTSSTGSSTSSFEYCPGHPAATSSYSQSSWLPLPLAKTTALLFAGTWLGRGSEMSSSWYRSKYHFGAKCGRCGLCSPTARNQGAGCTASTRSCSIALAAIIPSGTWSSVAVALAIQEGMPQPTPWSGSLLLPRHGSEPHWNCEARQRAQPTGREGGPGIFLGAAWYAFVERVFSNGVL